MHALFASTMKYIKFVNSFSLVLDRLSFFDRLLFVSDKPVERQFDAVLVLRKFVVANGITILLTAPGL
jgi:hypothetical protein